jgi:hypothetical protein
MTSLLIISDKLKNKILLLFDVLYVLTVNLMKLKKF